MSLLTFPLLIHLIKSNNLLLNRAKSTKMTKTTKEVFNAIVDEDRSKAKIFLQQVSIFLPKKKKKTFLILNASFAKRKTITSADVSKKRAKKLVSVLVTFTSVTIAREKTVRNAETSENSEIGENGRNDESDRNSKNREKDEKLEINLA